MFNCWNPFTATMPNTGIPTHGIPTNGIPTPNGWNGWNPWNTWNSFGPWNAWNTWNTNPYAAWWTGATPQGTPFANPWNGFFQAFFASFFDAFTAWQIQMNAFHNAQTFAQQPGFPGFGFPNFGQTFRNGWTAPTQDFAGAGFTQRNA